jgi:uncharacterized protein YbjT (DUF2867 family)
MPAKQTIAIVGATGVQGGGLARAILEDPDSPFAVRALTRKPESEKARALAELGAEVVAADLDDIDSLRRAFEGAHGAYCVTAFWEHFSPEREIAQAERMADAAQRVGVEHVIWSTLEDTRRYVPLDDNRMPTLMGRYKVPHYDAKGEADHLFTDRGVPTTLYRTSFYWDNFIHFGMGPKQLADGALAIAFPMADKRLPGMAAADIGRCAYGVFRRGSELIGETIGVAGGFLTGAELAAGLSKALGREVRYLDVDPAAFRAMDFPGAEDLGNMFQFKRDFEAEYCGNRSIELARELNPELQSFDVWLERHRHEIPIR